MVKERTKLSKKVVSYDHRFMQVNTSNSRARKPNLGNLEYIHRPLQKQNQTSQNVLMQHPSKEQAISKTRESGLAEILLWQQRCPPSGNPWQHTMYYGSDAFISHRPQLQKPPIMTFKPYIRVCFSDSLHPRLDSVRTNGPHLVLDGQRGQTCDALNYILHDTFKEGDVLSVSYTNSKIPLTLIIADS